LSDADLGCFDLLELKFFIDVVLFKIPVSSLTTHSLDNVALLVATVGHVACYRVLKNLLLAAFEVFGLKLRGSR
jgi:hypothetical protein